MTKENILSERKQKKITKTKKSFHRKYNFELFVLGLLLLGFFLLWERWEIKLIILNFITKAARTSVNLIRDIAVRIGTVISKMETSDLIGITLILIALILIMNRTRLRIIQSHPSLSSCSLCEGGLRQTHRKMKHKLLEILLFCKVKCYSCRKCSLDGIEIVTTKKQYS